MNNLSIFVGTVGEGEGQYVLCRDTGRKRVVTAHDSTYAVFPSNWRRILYLSSINTRSNSKTEARVDVFRAREGGPRGGDIAVRSRNFAFCRNADPSCYNIISSLRLAHSRIEYISACFCCEFWARVYTRKIRDPSLIWREDEASGTTNQSRQER